MLHIAQLVSSMLAYEPSERPTAAAALNHLYFSEQPLGMHPARLVVTLPVYHIDVVICTHLPSRCASQHLVPKNCSSIRVFRQLRARTRRKLARRFILGSVHVKWRCAQEIVDDA
jgi:serine/threonine protein kinase